MPNSFFFIIFFYNLVLYYFYKQISLIYNIFDFPDSKRKIHKTKIPLLGGLFIILNLFIIFLLNFFYIEIFNNNYFKNIESFFSFFLVAFFIYLLGFFDDKYKLNANSKLIITTIILILAVYVDQDILLKNLNFDSINYNINLFNYSYFFTIFCFLLFINAFNMLDGINGQASTYFLFILLIFLMKGLLLFLILAFIIINSFFLFYNFKNRIFLGDSGSLLLAYIIGYIFIKSYNLENKFSVEEIFLIMSVPGYELLRLAVTRLLNKRHPFKADNLHLHHLILKDFVFLKTFLIIQFILILPYAMYILLNNFLISIFLNLIFYTLVVRYFYSKSLKKHSFNNSKI
jgi:UDP-GlcNAc:undecaprenyl-phosphate GlcNAc-1-phosphate transferase